MTMKRPRPEPPPEFVPRIQRLIAAAMAEGLTRDETHECLHAMAQEVDRRGTPVIDIDVIAAVVGKEKAASFQTAVRVVSKLLKH